MKRFALAILLSALFASVSFAQQNPSDAPASREDIEKYLDTMHARDLMKSTLDAVTKQMHQMIHDELRKQPNLPADFEARMDKMMDDMFKNFPTDDLLQAMIPAYQKHLTTGEVDALTAFYATPTGQKILKEMPAMTAEAMQASTGIIQKMMAQAQQRVQSEIAQMQKENEGNSGKQPQSTPN
jgi:uncharacterized protein